MIKKFTLLFALAILVKLTAFSQNNVVVFSQEGEKFVVILNGIRQNSTPETNVKITGLIQPTYKLKIIFEDKTKPDADQTIYLMDGGNPVQGYEFTYSLINKNGAYKVKPTSYAMINQLPPPSPEQHVIVYTTTPAPETITTTTRTTTTTGGVNDNVAVGMSVGGVGMNMNININEGGNMGGTSTYTETTHTTTTTSTTNNSQPVQQTAYVMPGYNGPIGCPYPMSQNDFASVKQSISSKSFEDSKLTIAKQVINANCLLSSQVKEIMLLFSFEDTRLDLAKYAYGYTYDIGNYYKLNDAFTFESSIDDLNAYIQSSGR